ncbi:MAG: DUF4832 domain-containing protein [Bacillota bacterium]
MKTYNLSPSQNTIVNPARGFYVQFDSADTEHSGAVKMSELRNNGITLAMIGFDLKDFVTSDISVKKLAELDTALARAKKYGLKVVFRAAYSFSADSPFSDPKTIETHLRHIRQISTVVNKYSDIIYLVQAGFLGAWGEWHSSNLLSEDEKKNTQVRNQIALELAKTLDPTIIIDLRRPRFIRDAIAASIDKSRLGFHDDALISDETDMGTYDDPAFSPAQEVSWIDQNLNNSINGGEMPTLGPYSAADKAFEAFKSLHISYLNHEYNKDVLAAWKRSKIGNKSAYDTIENSLGYRLSLSKASIPLKISPSGKMPLEITLENNGFAPPPRNFTYEIAISQGKYMGYFPIGENSSEKLLSATAQVFHVSVDLPAKLTGLDIQVGLRIRPKAPSISDNPNYMIELANKTTRYIYGINFFGQYIFQNNEFVASEYK